MSDDQNKPLDFLKIDALRKHMLLTVTSLVAVLGTTRVSYYNWLKGGKVRGTKAAHIRKVVRHLVSLVASGEWPNPKVFVADQAMRLDMLQKALETLDNEQEQGTVGVQ